MGLTGILDFGGSWVQSVFAKKEGKRERQAQAEREALGRAMTDKQLVQQAEQFDKSFGLASDRFEQEKGIQEARMKAYQRNDVHILQCSGCQLHRSYVRVLFVNALS